MNRPRASWMISAPVVFLGVFLVVPVVHVAVAHLRPRQIVDVFGDPSLVRVMWFSLWQAIASTAATLAIGLPATWVLSRFSFPGRSFARGVLTAPFVMPAVVVAAGVLAVLPGTHNRGVGPIVWAHVIFNVAVIVRVVSPRWSMLDERLEDAAAVLGAGRLRTFTSVVWPQISGAVVNASTLVFVYCFTSFGVIAVLGEFGRRTVETEIYIQSVRLGDTRTASALAFVQAVFVAIVLIGSRRTVIADTGHGQVRAARALREHPGRRWAVALVPVLAVAVVIAPLAAVVVRSVRLRGEFTLAGWRALGTGALPGMTESAVGTIITSAVFALVTSAICVPLALVVVAFGRRGSSVLATLPMIISAATLGTGIIVTFNRDPFAWRSQTWLIPAIHAVIAFPLVVRTIRPAHDAIPARLRDAATMLGAASFQVWRRIDLVLLRPALARSFGLAMAVSLGEFGATSFLSRSGSTTMPIAIARLLGRPGDIPGVTGYALAAIMVIATVGVMSRA